MLVMHAYMVYFLREIEKKQKSASIVFVQYCTSRSIFRYILDFSLCGEYYTYILKYILNNAFY
jgi:hypothetical protein